MKRIFRGLMGDDTFTGGTSISTGMGASLLVPMTECYRPHLNKAFQHMGYYEDEIDRILTVGKIWFGIVDGNFRLLGTLELM